MVVRHGIEIPWVFALGNNVKKNDQRSVGIGDIDKFVAEALVTGL